MTAHQAVITPFDGKRGHFTCNHDTEKPFTEIWNESGTKTSTWVFGIPPEVFERIVQHLDADRHDADTRTIVEGERGQVALGARIEVSLRVLAEHLPDFTLTAPD